jgi:hypothetical protein
MHVPRVLLYRLSSIADRLFSSNPSHSRARAVITKLEGMRYVQLRVCFLLLQCCVVVQSAADVITFHWWQLLARRTIPHQ